MSSTASPTARPSWVPSMKAQAIATFLLMFCQIGITFTGNVVRVTGSGLGCNTWPNCHPGSLVPVAGAGPAVQQAIEFGNRMLAFVISAVAIIVIVFMHMAHRRLELKVLAYLNLVGIGIQAVIGGISVRLDLVWWSVAIHFLPSMLLIWLATLLWIRTRQPDDGTVDHKLDSTPRLLTIAATINIALVLITGTLVAGAGEHSGDADVGMKGRLGVNLETMAHIHSWMTYLYLALVIITLVFILRNRLDKRVRNTGLALLVLILVQAFVGIMQFQLGVPRWSVPIHVVLSGTITAVNAGLYSYSTVLRGGRATSTGSTNGDAQREAREHLKAHPPQPQIRHD